MGSGLGLERVTLISIVTAKSHCEYQTGKSPRVPDQVEGARVSHAITQRSWCCLLRPLSLPVCRSFSKFLLTVTTLDE